MAWLRGIQVAVVRRTKPQDSNETTTSPGKTGRSVELPEFPHPDASSVRLVRPSARASSPASSCTSRSRDSDPFRINKVQPKVSVYIPSEPDTRFGFEWQIDKPPEHRMYFILSINGRRIVSWGTNLKTANRGLTEYALYEPEDRWNYSEHGVVLRREGIEKRYFQFCPGHEQASIAGEGGLLEVQVFRSQGRQRRTPEPVDYRNQEKYGITCPSGGLIDACQDLGYYDWILIDPKDCPYATFRFYYRSWNTLRELALIPALSLGSSNPNTASDQKQDETNFAIAPLTFDTPSSHDDISLQGCSTIEVREDAIGCDKSFRGQSDGCEDYSVKSKWSCSRSLSSLSESAPTLPIEQSISPSNESPRDTCLDAWILRPLPTLPASGNISRRSSVASRTPSITPSLLPHLDEMSSEADDVEFGLATRVALSVINPDLNTFDGIRDRPFPYPPRPSSPSDYATSPPPSDASQSELDVAGQEYLQANGNSLEQDLADLSLSVPRTSTPAPHAASAAGTSPRISTVIHATIIPGSEWMQPIPERMTPSPIRRRKTQSGLNRLGSTDAEDSEFKSV